MTLEFQDKSSLSEIRMDKAYEFLQDAKANYNEGRYKTSINRSYYASLNAIRALLILQDITPQSHEGVITMLSLKFVKAGLIPVDIVKKFKLLLSRRTDVDYGDFESIEDIDAEDSLRISQEIIEVIDKVRKGMIRE
ncbi:MAG: HEPN domain-containing protein [bacterium]